MYAEGNMRTAIREFLQTEFKNGRLNLNKDDTFKVMNYSPMSEDDPILVFKKIYGDNSTKKVEEIVNVFEKGESFKHYEQLLRENVDTQFLKPLNQADVGDGKLVLTEAEEIKPKLPDDDDIPFNLGGRVGLFKGAEADARADRGAMSPGTSTSGGRRGRPGPPGSRTNDGPRPHEDFPISPTVAGPRPHEDFPISPTVAGPRPHEDFPISPTVADMGGPPRLTTSPTHVPKKEPKWGKTKTFLKTILPFVTPQNLIFSQFPKKAHIGLGALKGIKEIHELYSTPDEEETPGPAPLYATGWKSWIKIWN